MRTLTRMSSPAPKHNCSMIGHRMYLHTMYVLFVTT
jgi:hypothetical protein